MVPRCFRVDAKDDIGRSTSWSHAAGDGSYEPGPSTRMPERSKDGEPGGGTNAEPGSGRCGVFEAKTPL